MTRRDENERLKGREAKRNSRKERERHWCCEWFVFVRKEAFDEE